MSALTVTISHVGHRGDGIAERLFVPYTLAGETVEVEPEGDRLIPKQILTPSPERAVPFCPHYTRCGGCALQHWQKAPYLAWKREMVVASLRAVGLSTSVHATIDATGNGRRRVLFHARRGSGPRLVVGFNEARSRAVVGIDACPVLSPALAGALPAAQALARAIESLNKPLDLLITATSSGLDVDLRGLGALPDGERRRLLAVARDLDLARLTNHGDLVSQREQPSLTIGRTQVGLPPGAFLQATEAGEAALSELVLSALSPKARAVADLFCGIGPFTLRLAERVRVHAVDQDTAMVAALQAGARHTTGLKPVTSETRDLFRRPMTAQELKPFDAVVFDPARAGAEAQAKALAASALRQVLAVSCNPGTFARDAAILVAGGFELVEVTPVDQFAWTPHVELVARFERGPQKSPARKPG
jgi:23S rRNA (uracil1939-C5)-methyltransferase